MPEEPGHGQQQAQGQDGQAETALHLQRGAALHRGTAPAAVQAARFGVRPRTGREPTLCLLSSPPQRDEFTEETIKFGGSTIRTEEKFHIDSWYKRRSYDAFRQIMESGVREHLKVRTQSPSGAISFLFSFVP